MAAALLLVATDLVGNSPRATRPEQVFVNALISQVPGSGEQFGILGLLLVTWLAGGGLAYLEETFRRTAGRLGRRGDGAGVELGGRHRRWNGAQRAACGYRRPHEQYGDGAVYAATADQRIATSEAKTVEKRFDRVWKRADIKIKSPCLCLPGVGHENWCQVRISPISAGRATKWQRNGIGGILT